MSTDDAVDGANVADVVRAPRLASDVRPEDEPSSEPASNPLPPDFSAAAVSVGVGAREVADVTEGAYDAGDSTTIKTEI